jgi:flagellar biosynthesis/type III secretory pathway protein FliH
MARGGAQPWRWPELDRADREDGGFRADARPGPPEPAGPKLEEAEKLVRQRRHEAQQIVEAARADARQIRADARDEAHAQALSEARAQFSEELSAAVAEQVAAFEQARTVLLRQIEAAAAGHRREIEQELTGLVAAMAEKVIHRKLDSDDGVVLDVVRATIERASCADRLTVRVPAPDEERLREAMAELLAAADGPEWLEIVADETIGPGGCIVDTERGRFDARISTQIEQLSEEIGRVLGGGEGG